RAGAGVDRALDCAERRAGEALHRQEEVRMIGKIEDLSAELNALALRDLEEARDTQVEVIEPRPAQIISPCAAKRARWILLPSGRFTRKAIAQGPIGQQRARIKPTARPPIRHTPVSDHIRPVGILSRIALIGAT